MDGEDKIGEMLDGDDNATLEAALCECTRQLESLCEELGVDPIERDDEALNIDTRAHAKRCESTQLEISAMEIAAECMRTLEALSDIRQESEDTSSVDCLSRDAPTAASNGSSVECAQHEDCSPFAVSRDSVNRDLLDEMSALASELSDFAGLMVETSNEVAEECVKPQEEESVEDAALPKDPHEATAPGRGAPNCRETTVFSALEILTSNVQPPPSSADIRLRTLKVQPRAAYPPPPAHSRYQQMLRRYPPKPKPDASSRKGKQNDRTAAKHPLTSKVCEILNSPTLWREYQSKSFQQHIQRQQHARHLVEQEVAAAENACAAHFKRAQCGLKITDQRRDGPDEKLGGRLSTVYNATYLRQFWRSRKGRTDNKSVQEATDIAFDAAERQKEEETADGLVLAANGVLCGVYIYGNRHLGLAYFTFSTLPQLEERVCRHFRISAIANVYKERVLPCSRKRHGLKTKALQRITMFEQIRDGDRLCVTQDSYEDMAILCEWIKQRQLRLYSIQRQEPSTGVLSATTRSSSNAQAEGNSGTSEGYAATRSTAVRNIVSASTTATAGESLWDANGRSVSIKKQLQV